MIARRLLALAILPATALPRAAGQATTVVAPRPAGRNCSDPGSSFIACEALRDIMPLANAGSRCPLCGGLHRGTSGP
ncbi:MAG TPA: hypothetical protein VN329_16870 [Roseomonas sp.]|nr:hypothetical protein [Roseomonas sp.]